MAMDYFVREVLAQHLRESYPIGFDRMMDRETLIQALEKTNQRMKIGNVWMPRSMRGIETDDRLSGMKFEFPRGTVSFNTSKVFDSPLPVVTEGNRVQSLNSRAFSVGVLDAGQFQGEPYLELIERVVQMTSGLLLASRIRKIEQIQDSKIQAALLKDLFLGFSRQDQLIQFGPAGLRINRSVLETFVTEYLAHRQTQVSA
jgi:hypothetical protein